VNRRRPGGVAADDGGVETGTGSVVPGQRRPVAEDHPGVEEVQPEDATVPKPRRESDE
jgi:hypothetical protein